MSNETTIEIREHDFILRGVTLTYSNLWTRDPNPDYDCYSATVTTSDKDVMRELARLVQGKFASAGKQINAKDLFINGVGANSFLRAREDGGEGEDFSIILRSKKIPPVVLDADCGKLLEEDGINQTWLARCNVIASAFLTTKQRPYCMGILRACQITEPGEGGAGAISAEDAATAFGGTFKESSIGDYHTQGTSQPSGPGGPRAPQSNNRPYKDDELDDIPF